MSDTLPHHYKYLVSSPHDVEWGITVNTVGKESVPPGYRTYPPRSGHPDSFYFTPSGGRCLDSYQLLYITHGKGSFYTSPDVCVPIKEGDMLILQPHKWHSYFPDRRTGWQEYWIGFEGINIDTRFKNNFFNREQTIYRVGVQDSIVKLYEGMTMYYSQNCRFDDLSAERIDRAKVIIRERLLQGVSPEDVASAVNMSYSWFRKLFKDYTGLSPAHYILELKIRQAKDLLSTTRQSIKEIAYRLNFDDIPYFSKVFKKYTGLSPQSYRDKSHIALHDPFRLCLG